MLFDNYYLEKWEEYLNDLNSTCCVDEKFLLKIFSRDTIREIINNKLRNCDNISYLNSSSPFSLRYINDAFIYYSIIKNLNCCMSSVVDACSGNSKVIDIALALYEFNGKIVKVDYNKQIFGKNSVLKHEYLVDYHTFDIINETDKVPKADIIILNHAIDDLFMGLWSDDTEIDYFGYSINKIEENNKCWVAAMSNSEKYIKILNQFLLRLSRRLNNNGYIIIKNYPSGFETEFRQIQRINFTYDLTKNLVDTLIEEGLKCVKIELDLIGEIKWYDINSIYFIIQNKKVGDKNNV